MATAAAVKDEAAAHRFAKDHLKAFVERVERLEEEKKALSDDIRDVYAEAKANGFDVKALRTIVRMRKQDADERKEHEANLKHLTAQVRGEARRLQIAISDEAKDTIGRILETLGAFLLKAAPKLLALL